MKRLTLTLGVLALLCLTPPTLAGPTYAGGPALLPPPYIGWSASAWATEIGISSVLVNGSGIQHSVGTFAAQKVCNGGGSDDGGGEAYQSCGYTLKKLSDTEYVYTIREYSSEARLVRVTACQPMGGAWDCVRHPVQ